MRLSFGLLFVLVLSGCAADLVPVGKPDLSGPPGFCKQDNQKKLIVTVKNGGTGNAAASTTTIEFLPGGSFSLSTPAIAAGGTSDLAPLDIPAGCFNPDCEFKITVDANNQIKESNETNNSADGSCLG
jgi:subtilase family serine protease